MFFPTTSKNSSPSIDTRIPVRTLYFSLKQKCIENDIRKYFEQIGDVSDVEMHDAQSGIVVFKLMEGAQAALSNESSHSLGNCEIEVKEAEPWYQPDHIFNVLNEDCLRNILENFELDDLMNVAEVCTQLNRLSQHVFKAKFKRMQIEGSIFHKRLHYFEKMLRIFGNSIHSLSIRSFGDYSKILPMINEHTSQLKELKLVCFLVDKIENINSMLSNLEVLELNECCVEGLFDLLAVCTQLRILKIESSNIEWTHIPRSSIEDMPLRHVSQPLAKLEEIHFYGFIGVNDMRCLISLGCRFKVLVLNPYRGSILVTPEMFQLHHNLEKLVLFNYVNREKPGKKPLQPQQHIRLLKTLRVNFGSMSFSPSMTFCELKHAPIAELELTHIRINNIGMSILTQIKTIRSLELSWIDRFTDEQMIQLAEELPQLRNFVLCGSTADKISGNAVKQTVKHATKLTRLALQLWDCNQSLSIDVNDYDEMLRAVQSRADGSILSINIASANRKIVFVHEEILSKNHEWIRLNPDCKFYATGQLRLAARLAKPSAKFMSSRW